MWLQLACARSGVAAFVTSRARLVFGGLVLWWWFANNLFGGLQTTYLGGMSGKARFGAPGMSGDYWEYKGVLWGLFARCVVCSPVIGCLHPQIGCLKSFLGAPPPLRGRGLLS